MPHQYCIVQQLSLSSLKCFCNCVEKKGEIDKLAEEYISSVRNLASEQRVEHLQKIQSAYSKCKEFSDDKVQLAMQTYEMVSAPNLAYEYVKMSVLSLLVNR